MSQLSPSESTSSLHSKQMNHANIQSTQLSHALSLNTNLKLIDVKNFSIHHSPKRFLDVTSFRLPSIISSPNLSVSNQGQLLTKKLKKLKIKIHENNIDEKAEGDSMEMKKRKRLQNFDRSRNLASEVESNNDNKWFKMLTDLKESSYKLNKLKIKSKVNLEEKYRDLFSQPNSVALGYNFITESEKCPSSNQNSTNCYEGMK